VSEQQPVPGMSFSAGTPSWTSVSSSTMRSSAESEFASLLVPNTARPLQPFASSHLQWRT